MNISLDLLPEILYNRIIKAYNVSKGACKFENK